jgi:gluconolactonase
MLRFLPLLLALLCLPAGLLCAQPAELTPDSQKQADVPEGRVEGPFEWKSKIFPGTVRNYWVYVPQQYDKDKPACQMIIQDGLGRANAWKLPTVMDNLIAKGEIPVMIGIFIEPGVVPAVTDGDQPRFNRSFEYDAMGDRYARFLLDEILPEVGKSYNLSDDPNDRGIGGASSGAICAFTAAWERPSEFRRVLSTIGTYVGLRGGNEYPVLVRKTEPKPIRVFLQDGSNDLNIYAGDWWVANQDMLSALKFSGYEVKHAWGEGGHDNKAQSIIPDAMRWLWAEHGQPLTAGVGRGAKRRTDLLIADEPWQLVSEGHRFTEGPAVNSKGEVFFTDIPNNRIHKIGLDGKVSTFAENTGAANGLMFRADGSLLACQSGNKQIAVYDAGGEATGLIEGAPSNDLLVFGDGSGFFTDPENKKVWHFTAEGAKKVVDEGIGFANGVIASPGQEFLYVSDTRGRFIYSYQIQADGSLRYKQPYGYLHLTEDGGESGADGMTVDSEGRLYVTTRLGVQILDQLGRVHLILEKPDGGWLSNCVFGGPELDTLYVTCGGKVYKRKLKARGVIPWQEPLKAPRPGL